jgi:hypothetical protein
VGILQQHVCEDFQFWSIEVDPKFLTDHIVSLANKPSLLTSHDKTDIPFHQRNTINLVIEIFPHEQE